MSLFWASRAYFCKFAVRSLPNTLDSPAKQKKLKLKKKCMMGLEGSVVKTRTTLAEVLNLVPRTHVDQLTVHSGL